MDNRPERYWEASSVSISPARPVLIAISFYRNEELVESVVGSLIACADDITAIGGEVVLYDDSPDYPPLAAALGDMAARTETFFPCRVVRNTANLGFVKTMNQAIREAVARGYDLILLNSDTVIFPGALTEMVRVMGLDPMIAFVNPRSDNATLATLPVKRRGAAKGDQQGFDLAPYSALAARLPEFSYTPTAVGFCLLIRHAILAEFGGFDEVFSPGYNEENDLVMRAGRCGYRAVLANKAFVRHFGEKSFDAADIRKITLEPRNRAILDARYPEYSAFTSAYFHSPEVCAEAILAALTPDENGRLDFAFDFSSFTELHNGTYAAGRQLLQAAAADWHDRFNIHVLCSPETYEFHEYGALGVKRCDPHGPETFAAIFRVGQPYDWNAVERLVMKGAAIGIYMLDTISIDCTQLTSPMLYDIWQFALANIDLVAAQSNQTANHFSRRFHLPDHVIRITSMHSLDLDDYRLPVKPVPHGESSTGAPALLVIGNHFPHKYLVPTANALAEAFPHRRIIALGQTAASVAPPLNPYGLPLLKDVPNLTGIAVGQLAAEELAALYGEAAAVVFPTHYEGFGFPLLDALAAARPVFVRRLPVFEEIWEAQGRNPNVHFFETTSDLVARLATIPRWIEPAEMPASPAGIEQSARSIRAGMEAAIAGVAYRRLIDRIRAIQLVGEIAHEAAAVAAARAAEAAQPFRLVTPADYAARLLSRRVERIARFAFRIGPLMFAARIAFRLMHPVWRALRHIGPPARIS